MNRNRVFVELSPGAGILFCAVLLLLSAKTVFAWLIAVAVHECCHCLVILLLGKRIQTVKIGIAGMQIATQTLRPIEEMLCTAAGPVGSISLLFFAKWIPITALFGAIQGLYNLFPLYPMDGGRMLHILCYDLIGLSKARQVCTAVKWLFIVIIMIGVICFAWRFQMWHIILALGFVILTKIILLANQAVKGYNKTTSK